MAIVVGNETTITGASASSRTVSHNNNGTFVVVAFGNYDAESIPLWATSVTYGGQAMTLAVRTAIEQGGDSDKYHHAYIYYLVNPPTGANNVVLTWSKPTSIIGGGIRSFNGVLQVSPLDDTDTETTNTQVNSKTITLVASQGGTLFVDSHNNDGAASAPSNPTRDGNITTTNGDEFQTSYIANVPIGSDDYISGTASSDYMAYCGALFKPAPRGGAFLLTQL